MKTILHLILFGLLSLVLVAYAADERPRWPIKTSVPLPMDGAVVVSFDELVRFPPQPNPRKTSVKGDSKYQLKRYPPFRNSLGLREGSIVSLTGYLHLVASEKNDGDYHIQISGSPTDGNNCIIVKVPAENEGPAELHPYYAKVRKFVRDRLLKGEEPSSGGNVMNHAPYVEVAGQLFFDDWFLNEPARGKRGMKAATLWEIHPVLGIRFAPKK